jgi:hypothetical protein
MKLNVYSQKVARILSHIKFESGPRMILENRAKRRVAESNCKIMKTPMSLPLLLLVMGPPKSGKTVLAKALGR